LRIMSGYLSHVLQYTGCHIRFFMHRKEQCPEACFSRGMKSW
jgi:hypothetical protein